MSKKATGAVDPRPIKLSCNNLWKVFGPHAAEFMAARGGTATSVELDQAHLIGAVRNAADVAAVI